MKAPESRGGEYEGTVYSALHSARKRHHFIKLNVNEIQGQLDVGLAIPCVMVQFISKDAQLVSIL